MAMVPKGSLQGIGCLFGAPELTIVAHQHSGFPASRTDRSWYIPRRCTLIGSANYHI